MANNNTNNKQSGSGKKIALIFLLVLIVTLGITYVIFNISSGQGTQAGVLIKFEQTGVVMKTYEGELNIGGMNTVPNTAQANEAWRFSVRDEETAKKLMQLTGRKVSLHYSKIIKSLPWQGQTNVFVDGAEVIP
jgi:flagellar basal body-associated protein FliL